MSQIVLGLCPPICLESDHGGASLSAQNHAKLGSQRSPPTAQSSAFGFLGDEFGHVGRHGYAAGRGGACADRIAPPVQMRKIVDLEAGPPLSANPAPTGNVGDRVLAGDELIV